MKTSITYRHADSQPLLEAAVERHIHKVESLLKHYDPDLVLLHGCLEKHARRIEYTFSVNLSLPTGTLHAVAKGADPKQSARAALVELESQIKKHQARLRKDSAWRRKGGTVRALA